MLILSYISYYYCNNTYLIITAIMMALLKTVLRERVYSRFLLTRARVIVKLTTDKLGIAVHQNHQFLSSIANFSIELPGVTYSSILHLTYILSNSITCLPGRQYLYLLLSLMINTLMVPKHIRKSWNSAYLSHQQRPLSRDTNPESPSTFNHHHQHHTPTMAR